MAVDGGNLNLGHILLAGEITRFGDILAIRHTPKTLEGIRTSADATPANLLEYTRHQDLRASKIPPQPPKHLADLHGRWRPPFPVRLRV